MNCKMRTATLLAMVLAGGAAHAQPELPEPGPIVEGLQLRLAIEPVLQDGKPTEDNSVILELINGGEEDRTLVADWFYESEKGDYRAFLGDQVLYGMRPSTYELPAGPQTLGEARRSPQPTFVLKAGDSLAVHKFVLEPDARYGPRSVPYAPLPGLYSVQARVEVIIDGTADAPAEANKTETAEKSHKVRLHSNYQEMCVGNTREMPKHQVVDDFTFDKSAMRCTLRKGSLHKLELGDIFYLRTGILQAPCWGFRIDKIGAHHASGKLVLCKARQGRRFRHSFPDFVPTPRRYRAVLVIDPEFSRDRLGL